MTDERHEIAKAYVDRQLAVMGESSRPKMSEAEYERLIEEIAEIIQIQEPETVNG